MSQTVSLDRHPPCSARLFGHSVAREVSFDLKLLESLERATGSICVLVVWPDGDAEVVAHFDPNVGLAFHEKRATAILPTDYPRAVAKLMPKPPG